MWVADWEDDKLYAYDLEDKTRVSGKDFDGLGRRRATTDPARHLVRRNRLMWGGRLGMTTKSMPISPGKTRRMEPRAKTSTPWWPLATETRRESGQTETTMWVVDANGDDKIYAYDLASKARVPSRDFDALGAANQQ